MIYDVLGNLFCDAKACNKRGPPILKHNIPEKRNIIPYELS